jgi:hypothetical protein
MTLSVILVGTVPFATPATSDPALDIKHASAKAALSRYARERSPEALAAVPMLPGAKAVQFRVEALTVAGLRLAESDPARASNTAFALCCHSYVDAKGIEHTAAQHGGVQAIGDFALADETWLQHVGEEFGTLAIDEVASVAITRAKAGKRALAPFALPRGLTLAV